MSRQLLRGTVTLVFTDIEGSTQLLQGLGAERHEELLAEHRRLVRQLVERHGGFEIDTQGEAFFLAFPGADEAVETAAELQQALVDGLLKVRIGIHTGQPRPTSEATSARTSTLRPACAPRVTVDRCCCRLPPETWSTLRWSTCR